MDTSRYKKRKKPNFKRGIFLLLILLVIILLWFNIEDIISSFFEVKE